MMGFYYGPASTPPQTSAWWIAPSGPATTTAWQLPNENHWWSQPQPNVPAWARPAASIQLWNEQPAQWVQHGLGSPHQAQQLALTAYASPQHPTQQQGHCLQAQPLPTQHKDQDTVQQSIEHAYRIAQLETALKVQEQRHKEEAIQGAVTMQQYVSQQMEDWRTWKESEENSQTHKDKQAAAQLSPQHSEHVEHRTKQQETCKKPTRARSSQQSETSEHPDFEVKPLIKRLLTGMDVLLKGQAAAGAKRRRSHTTEDSPPKRTTHFAKAYIPDKQYQKPTSSISKQTKPMLPQKHKAQPSQPPWKPAPSVSRSVRRRQPIAKEQAAQEHAATGQEIVISTPNSPKDEEIPGQLPPLTEIDGKAIHQDFPPFDKTPSWEPAYSQK